MRSLLGMSRPHIVLALVFSLDGPLMLAGTNDHKASLTDELSGINWLWDRQTPLSEDVFHMYVRQTCPLLRELGALQRESAT